MNLIFFEKIFIGHMFLYGTLSAFIVAVLAQMTSYAFVRSALNESENAVTSKKGWLKSIRQRYIYADKPDSPIVDIDVFIEKQLMKSGVGMISSVCERISGTAVLICVVCSVTQTMLAILFEAERIEVFLPLVMGVWALALVRLISFFADNAHKYNVLKNNIKYSLRNERLILEELAAEKETVKEKQPRKKAKEELRAERINRKWQEIEIKKAKKQQKKMEKLKKKMEKVQNSYCVSEEIGKALDTPENRRREQKEALLAECRVARRKLEAEDSKIINEVLNEFLA